MAGGRVTGGNLHYVPWDEEDGSLQCPRMTLHGKASRVEVLMGDAQGDVSSRRPTASQCSIQPLRCPPGPARRIDERPLLPNSGSRSADSIALRLRPEEESARLRCRQAMAGLEDLRADFQGWATTLTVTVAPGVSIVPGDGETA